MFVDPMSWIVDMLSGEQQLHWSEFATSSSLFVVVVCCVSVSSLCSWGCEEEFVRAWCPRGEEQRWGGVGLQHWYYHCFFYFYPRRQHWCSTL